MTDLCIHPEDFQNYHWYKYVRMADDTLCFVDAALNHSDAIEIKERSQVKSAGTFTFYPDKIVMRDYGSTTLGVDSSLCALDECMLSDLLIRPVKTDW